MSSCFVIEMVYEKTLYRPTLYEVNLNPRQSLIPISSQHWITDSLSEKLMDSGFRSLVGSRIPWWGECPRIQIFLADFPDSGFRRQKFQGFRNLDYLATLNDSRMACVFFGGHFIFFGRLLCDLEPRNFGGSGTIGNFENSRRSIHLPSHYRACINEIR